MVKAIIAQSPAEDKVPSAAVGLVPLAFLYSVDNVQDVPPVPARRFIVLLV